MRLCPRYLLHSEIESDVVDCSSLSPSMEQSGQLDCSIL